MVVAASAPTAEPEPLSVSAMRLATTHQSTTGLADEDDDGETQSVVSAAPGPGRGGDAPADPDATDAHADPDDARDEAARPDR